MEIAAVNSSKKKIQHKIHQGDNAFYKIRTEVFFNHLNV